MRCVWSVLALSIIAAMLCSAALAVVTTGPPTPISKVVEGSITAITLATPTSGKITVAPAPGLTSAPTLAPVTFIVNEKTKLSKDGKVCSLAALAVGDKCRALVVKNAEGGLVALVVYATTVVPPARVNKGTIFDKAVIGGVRTFKLRLPATAALPEVIRWFGVSDATKVMVDGKPANYDLLANGQTAEVAYVMPPPSPLTIVQPIIALSVAARNPLPPPPPPPVRHVIGRLTSVDLAGGIIQVLVGSAAAPVEFKITDATKIDKFGPSILAALVPAGAIPDSPGDMVDVAATMWPSASPVPPAAISVVVAPHTRMGTVARVEGSTLWINQAASPGAPVVLLAIPFKVVPATKIIRNGLPATLAQLMSRDSVTLKYFQFWDAKVAQLIEARSSLPPFPPRPL